MPIQLGDVKLVASAVMDDVPEGGGAPTAHVIQDGVSNEIFKDISESDRARGRLNMSKVFVSVQTDDVDTYLGANFIVASPPQDPNVSVTIFSNDQVYDTRTQAQTRMESYLNKGPEWPGFLYENHIAGQRTIQFFQRPGSEIPAVGKTLVLVQNEGASNQIEQYVRATRVSVVERTFTYNNDQDYKALIVSLELSDALRNDMLGTPANRQFVRQATGTRVRDTVVADAGSYAGVVPLGAPINIGDFSLRATTVYSPLVPSAQVETPITASTPYSKAVQAASTHRPVTYSTTQTWNPSNNLTLPGGCAPGTLTIVMGATTIVDKAGALMAATTQVGTIDYANGILTTTTTSWPSSRTVTYTPAAHTPTFPQSRDIQVTAENRSLSYVGFLHPSASPGTVSVSYQVQGRWYVLTDGGDGALRGFDASFGVGTYNPTTSDFVLTLGALPDVGSAIIFQWGVPTQEYSHAPEALKVQQIFQLEPDAENMIDPAYLKVTWLEGSTTKTATANSAGDLTGDATGKVDIRNSLVKFWPTTLPLPGTQLTVEYDTGPRNELTLPHPVRNGAGLLPVNAGAINLVPGSVVVEWNTYTDLGVLGVYTREQLDAMGVGIIPAPSGGTTVDPIHTARDDGTGKLFRDGVEVGTVNYATGDIVFNPDATIRIPTVNYAPQQIVGTETERWRVNYQGISYLDAGTLYPNDESGWVKIRYYSAIGSTRESKVFTFAPEIELVPGVMAEVVPGSVVLTAPGIWGDSGTGELRELTNSGLITRGTIDYVTGKVELTSWPANMPGNITRATALTTIGTALHSAYVFRTAAAPLRPGSLSFQYAIPGGGTGVVTAASDGTISAPGIVGTVDYQSGVVRIGFGTMVTAAGNESEPWYDASRVVTGGMIFKPNPVAASSLIYNAVAYSYLPLDAELIGVDPVRLPSDGRVPIFRNGSMVVVGNTKVSAPMTPVNNQVVDVGRTRLSRAVVRDVNDRAIYTGYTVDLEMGTVTFTDVSEMDMPVKIEDRIEDMLVARDVQISGEMTFTRQVTHAYPVTGTYVSSALEFGDRKARVSVTFDQATWDGVTWTDAPTGPVATASYNSTLAPIEVTNAGASTERFAMQFTSASTFRVVGEHVGVIATGTINEDCSPTNPATGQPYFTIRALGWGTGWAVGNVLRINTVGSLCPVWVVRTTQPGPEAGINYSFDLLTRGDVDRVYTP